MVWCKMFIIVFCVIYLSEKSIYDVEVMCKVELCKILKVLYNLIYGFVL